MKGVWGFPNNKMSSSGARLNRSFFRCVRTPNVLATLSNLISADTTRSRFRDVYKRQAYTPRELKTREDWNEWQANVLGAAILLPQKEVDLAMRRFAETPLINYEGRYSYEKTATAYQVRTGGQASVLK